MRSLLGELIFVEPDEIAFKLVGQLCKRSFSKGIKSEILKGRFKL